MWSLTTPLHVVVDSNPWSLDWNAVVAIATGILALFTFRLARSTTKLAAQTQTLAVQTEKLAREAAEDIASGFRPVLVDASGGKLDLRYPVRQGAPGELRIAIRNVGPGAAINISARLLIKHGGTPWSYRFDFGTVAGKNGDTAAEAAGDIDGLPRPSTPLLEAELTCDYEDLSKVKHRTVLSYRLKLARRGNEVGGVLSLPLTSTDIRGPLQRQLTL